MINESLERLKLISKLQKEGLVLSNSQDLVDWKSGIIILTYEGREIRVKIIVSERLKYNFDTCCDFDYIIVTSSLNYWVIPKELIKNVDYPKKTFEKLKDSANLLKISDKLRLLGEINDKGVKFGDILRTGVFFTKNTDETPQTLKV